MKRLCALMLLTLLALSACGDVSFVERVVIVNDTEYPANVDVRGTEGGWLGLTTVPPEETREVAGVIDQGKLWTFRFGYAGRDPVEIEIGRDELAAADWQVEVPLELEENLRADGVPPPP